MIIGLTKNDKGTKTNTYILNRKNEANLEGNNSEEFAIALQFLLVVSASMFKAYAKEFFAERSPTFSFCRVW